MNEPVFPGPTQALSRRLDLIDQTREDSMTDNEAELFSRITFLKEEIQNLKKDIGPVIEKLDRETTGLIHDYQHLRNEVERVKAVIELQGKRIDELEQS